MHKKYDLLALHGPLATSPTSPGSTPLAVFHGCPDPLHRAGRRGGRRSGAGPASTQRERKRGAVWPGATSSLLAPCARPLLVGMPLVTSSDALVPSSFLLLIEMPGATSSRGLWQQWCIKALGSGIAPDEETVCETSETG